MEDILLKNQDSRGFKVLIAAAASALFLALFLFLIDAPGWYALTASGVGITLFAATSIDNFKHTNIVNYDSKSVTVKLLGRRTFGFMFGQIEQVSLSEKGLLLRVQGQDAITLSRKRYKEQALREFYNLIIKYK
jgi:hypothetical protein